MRRLVFRLRLPACGFLCLFLADAAPIRGAQSNALYEYYRDELVRTGNTGHVNQLVVAFLCPQCVTEVIAARLIQDSGRTDKQVGTAVSTTGATTLAENAGLEELLALAVERGAVSEEKNGSTVTLNTTPYIIATGLGTADTAQNWDDLALLRRIGLSATFAATGSDSNLGDFQGGEVKIAITGSRSPRDTAVAIAVGPEIRSALNKAAGNLAADLAAVYEGVPSLDPLATRLRQWIEQKGKDGKFAASGDEVDAEMKSLFHNIPLTRDQQNKAQAAYRSSLALFAAEDVASATLKELTDLYLKRGVQLSVSYLLDRQNPATPISTAKLLFGYDALPKIQANLNAHADFNNERHAADGSRLEQLKSFGIEAGLTMGRFARNKSDLSIAARVTRERPEAMTAESFQAKTNLYLTPALTVPVALTYVNREPNGQRGHLHFNIGVALSADTLLGVGSQAKTHQ